MGLGPRGSSLLERLRRPPEPGEDTLWIQIDQQTRGEARQQARTRHQQKHKTPKKPLAPVEQTEQRGEDRIRLWKWIGEDIPSKNLWAQGLVTGEWIRKCGFKLPKLTKK
jgi:hypothetical protein